MNQFPSDFSGALDQSNKQTLGENGEEEVILWSPEILQLLGNLREQTALISFTNWAFNHWHWLPFAKCVVFLLGTIADYRGNGKEKVKLHQHCFPKAVCRHFCSSRCFTTRGLQLTSVYSYSQLYSWTSSLSLCWTMMQIYIREKVDYGENWL